MTLKDDFKESKKSNTLLNGLEPEMSLQTVNFANTEYSYLNEHVQIEDEEI